MPALCCPTLPHPSCPAPQAECTPDPLLGRGGQPLSPSSCAHQSVPCWVWVCLQHPDCFTTLCWSLPHIDMNRPRVHVRPLPPPSPHPTPPGCPGAPGLSSSVSHTGWCSRLQAAPSVRPALVSSGPTSLPSTSASPLLPEKGFISTVLLDSAYTRQYTIVAFLLAYFTLYNRLSVHPPH